MDRSGRRRSAGFRALALASLVLAGLLAAPLMAQREHEEVSPTQALAWLKAHTGTDLAEKGYEHLGPRIYSEWIGDEEKPRRATLFPQPPVR